jgi:hypothetical protein
VRRRRRDVEIRQIANLFGEFWQLRGHTRKEGYATMTITHLLRVACGFMLAVLCFTCAAMGQTETATISGLITDDTGAVMPGAEVQLQNIERGTSSIATTNKAGIYVFTSVHPGPYQLTVHKPGFRQVDLLNLIVNVQDHIEQNFRLRVGSVSESVTVHADDLHINTEDASVSTVVDRKFAENLPMNGRSFQTLIQLTPGVVLTANNGTDAGQFSVNGQRADTNYWMVDGVSGNIGISPYGLGSSMAGTLGSTSVLGGTNSLVSVDALQEFRIQTSTYAPEFGRTPGGQISIVTRSGTNQFHGTGFDYFRNDVLDANDWFNGVNIFHSTPLPKAQERQNDFGGTFSGPIVKGRTFFFFSYEGLRLRLPQTSLTLVPDTNPQDPYSRQFANADIVPYLNAFPRPNGPQAVDLQGNPIPGVAQFNASYSNPATLDAYSLRLDHKVNDKWNLFGRYDYSPSKLTQRGLPSAALSTILIGSSTTQTATLGAVWAISSVVANDFRFNYSNTRTSASNPLDTFGGATPLGSLPFTSPYTAGNSNFSYEVDTLGNFPIISTGAAGDNRQRQFNLVDSVSLQRGSHSLKFGVDYRRLSPRSDPQVYGQSAEFADMPSAAIGSLELELLTAQRPATFLFRNLGSFAQDTWRVTPHLTITYGLRWDVDFVPSALSGPDFNAVTGFDLANLANLALLPSRTAPYKTKWGNLASRIGLAYAISRNERWQTVLRGGFGVFYDLASSQIGSILGQAAYPFEAYSFPSGSFPLASASPPPILPPDASNMQTLSACDPNLRLPYTLQWNVAVEQALGKQQTLSGSYVGASGRRLLQTAFVIAPNNNLTNADLITNTASSDYNALQLQFQRRLSGGLQALASYSWSHSLDTGSAGSNGNFSNLLSVLNSNVNRGPSAFDVRNSFSAALTYDMPTPKENAFAKQILRGWSTENIIQTQSARPVDVYYSYLGRLTNGFFTNPRPDVVAGEPFYLYGPQYPGGKAFNPAAFTAPPLAPTGCDPASPPCYPARQGDLPRNALRAFGSAQWDFAIHREFVIHESVKLQFRSEMFNVLNHPNFGPPVGDLQSPSAINPQFGLSPQLLGQSLSGTRGGGGLDPLYQLGGPRSIQFALKLVF